MIPPALHAFLLVPLADGAPAPRPVLEPADAALALPAPLAPPEYLWRDFDRDGRSDVYVRSPAGEDRLLRHGGAAFEDVTARLGLAGVAGTRSVAWTDLEADGLPDLFLVDADGRSRLYHNAGTSFVDVTEASGVAHAGPVVFHEWVDGEEDGLSDLHVVTPEEDVLFQNLGRTRFAAVALPTGGAGTIVGGLAGAAPVDAKEPGLAVGGFDAQPRRDRAERGAAAPRATRRSSGGGTQELGTCGTLDVDDQGAAGCLQASSVPTLGMLYPLSTDLNVDGAGQVGIGTTTPTAKLDVDGAIRSRSGGIEFPDGTTQTTAEAIDAAFVYGQGANPSATLQFLAPPAVVTIADGQRIHVTSNKALGTRYTSGACCLSLWVGYRALPSGTIVTVGGGMLGNKVNRNTRTVHGVNGVITGLPGGQYEVGMVGGTADPNWDFNGAGYTSALVLN